MTAFVDGANVVQVAYNPSTGCLAVWANDTSSFPGYDVADTMPSAVSAQRAGIPLPADYTPPTAPRPLPVVATCQAAAEPGFRYDTSSGRPLLDTVVPSHQPAAFHHHSAGLTSSVYAPALPLNSTMGLFSDLIVGSEPNFTWYARPPPASSLV